MRTQDEIRDGLAALQKQRGVLEWKFVEAYSESKPEKTEAIMWVMMFTQQRMAALLWALGEDITLVAAAFEDSAAEQEEE